MLAYSYMEKPRDILNRFDIKAVKRYGQNFLQDTNLLKSIVRDSGIDDRSVVLEIGPGLGALTIPLLETAKRVVAIEIDQRLEGALRSATKEFSNFELILNDVLKISPQRINELMGGRFSVVANLPYYITSPILFYLLENDFPIDSITVMVQKEVADRMVARENTEAYGALTAAIALYSNAEIKRTVCRRMFFPSPEVDSAIVHLTLHDKYIQKGKALRLIKCAFSMRRKTLLNNILKDYRKSREEIEGILLSLSIDTRARGESLSVDQLYSIAELL